MLANSQPSNRMFILNVSETWRNNLNTGSWLWGFKVWYLWPHQILRIYWRQHVTNPPPPPSSPFPPNPKENKSNRCTGIKNIMEEAKLRRWRWPMLYRSGSHTDCTDTHHPGQGSAVRHWEENSRAGDRNRQDLEWSQLAHSCLIRLDKKLSLPYATARVKSLEWMMKLACCVHTTAPTNITERNWYTSD